MNKGGQITIFILLSLVLLIGFILVYSIKNDNKYQLQQNVIQNSEEAPLKLFIENCIDYTVKNGLTFIGKQGGYYEVKSPFVHYNDFDRPLYLNEILDLSPSLNNIEYEISNYVRKNLPSCFDGLNEFKIQGFTIEKGNVNVTTSIGYSEVYVKTEIPLKIKKDSDIYNLKSFRIAVNIPFGKIYNVSREIINLQLKDKNKLCLNCLNSLKEKSDVYIDVTEYINNTLIFDLRAYNTSISTDNYASYNFTFAVKYRGMSCNYLSSIDDFVLIVDCLEAKIDELKNEIVLEQIQDVAIKVGEEFYFDVNASGRGLNFEDSTDLFDIDSSSGEIKFIPTEEHVGEHQIWLRAFDKIGNDDYENFFIKITK